MKHFIVPKNISDREYFHHRNALKVFLIILSEINADGHCVISINSIKEKAKISRDNTEESLHFLIMNDRIDLYRIKKNLDRGDVLYYIELGIKGA